MRPAVLRPATAALLAVTWAAAAQAQSAPRPEQQLAALVKAYLALETPPSWEATDKLPLVKWAAGVTSLQNCLPDGGCFVRQGTATVGGRTITVVATGARSFVLFVYLRNGGAAVGEAAMVGALGAASLTTTLARCPVPGSAGGTNWYRVAGGGQPGILSVQTTCNGRPCEGLSLSHGTDLPALQPNQLALYSESCGAGAERKAVASNKPHEALAEAVVAMLTPATGPALADWKAFQGIQGGVAWDSAGPKAVNYSSLGDPNPWSLNGRATYAQRAFSARASGTQTQVKTVHLEEIGQHPRGEHMLGVVHTRGIAVRLVRCGPVYTQSTNNWYSLQSTGTRPAMIRQSIRYDGNQVSDAYELRLDGTLPPRDPRDREPGVSGCQ